MQSLLAKSYRYAFQNSIPLMATIELTHGCNFRCSHCYNFDRTIISHKPTGNEDLLSLEEVFHLIEELHKLGTLIVNLTGGEASLYPKLDLVIKKCRSLNMEPRIKTNAANLSPKLMDQLFKAGLAGMDVSLYGFSEKVYVDFTRTKDAFKKVIENILYAKELGLEVIGSIILHRDNVIELSDMIHFFKSHNLQFNVGTEITERYDDSIGAKNYEITKEQYKALLQSEHKEFFEHRNEEKSLQCSCARSVIGIGKNGDVYPCIGAPIKSGNIREAKLTEIWKNSKELIKIRELEFSDYKACNTCDFIESCNRSSGSIFINTGVYTGCDEKTLEQAKLRSELTSNKNT